MHSRTIIKWLALGALVLGALCSSALMAFVSGGWKPGALKYVAWALMPYAVLALILLCARFFRIDRSVQLLSVWAILVIALGGPALYIDAMFVHVDAQGALVVLMIPVIQTALGLVVVVVVLLWQWRISRNAAMPTGQAEGNASPLTTALWRVAGMKKSLRNIFVSAIIIGALLYAFISMLQSADSATIKTAKEVDAFINQYCANNNRLPVSGALQSQFPNLNRGSGWFVFTDDKTYLIVQYPMRWSNKDAIGERKHSEFTATVYAYTVDYHCKKAK